MSERDEARVKELGLAGEGSNWPHVFYYAHGGEDGPFWVVSAGVQDRYETPAGATAAPAFDIADVERVEGSVAGDNDGPDWVAWGLLRDGRWFSVAAGCDYTGWG